MQVACANCQLSFQAPDGATGLVCPICRSPLRPPGASATDATPAGAGRQILDWAGGTLDDLISLLSTPAWSARVEVLSSSENPVGEVHVIAGGVSDAIFEGRASHEALDRLRAVKGARYRVEPRLPNPTDGDLTFPGPDQGKLEERPLAQLMRYCEDYVLTTAIEVWRGNESAKVEYRRGEIVGVTVGGIDAPERLAEVMQWASGNYRLIMPRLTLPETAPKTAAPPPAAVVAPRAAGAASKTIFGMPAVDARALAVGAKPGLDAGRASPAPTGAAPAGATPASPAASAPAASPASGEQARPSVGGESHASTSTPAPAARDRAAAARTIFGVAAVPVPSGSAPPTRPTPESGSTVGAGPASGAPSSDAASSASAATAASAAAPVSASVPAPNGASAAGAEKPVTPAPVAAKAPATDKAAGRAEKPATSSGQGRGGRSATPSPKEKTRAPSSSPASRDDRAHPTQQIATRPAETPIWTYVGVGFVFGLALLGVYWLVMVLAN